MKGLKIDKLYWKSLMKSGGIAFIGLGIIGAINGYSLDGILQFGSGFIMIFIGEYL